MPYYALLVLLYALYYFTSKCMRFSKNLRDARSSGLPYIVSPIYGYDRLWLTTEPLFMPILRRLPKFLTTPWIDLVSGDWAWHSRYTPFSPSSSSIKGLGSDTFIIVSPRQNILCTADATVINQITTRRNDFPKPIKFYKALDVYGKNVVSVEGAEWRRHRKVTAPQFNEKSNAVVWKESIFQASEMMKSWCAGASQDGAKSEDMPIDGTSKNTLVSELSKDAMRLSLHVISRAGFGVRCLWPGANDTDNESLQENSMSSTLVPEGHEMSYTDSLETLLHRIIAILILPDWFLKYSPFQLLRGARKSYIEWGKYMHEIYSRNLNDGDDSHGLDLMGAMIRNSGQMKGQTNKKSDASLSQSEIMGNSFVLFLAGHETAANSIHFVVLYLAIRPDVQRKLQAELGEIFGSRPPLSWDYDVDLPRLFSGLAGAIMNEELRLIPPVVNIPKSTLENSPQPLNVDGKEYIVPGGTYINLCTVAVHRNPKHWPHGPSRREEQGGSVHPTSNVDNDLEEFRPERWFIDEDGKSQKPEKEQKYDDDAGVDETPDTATTMFRPPKGAYIPFSEGYRACLGRRFAQVEILATIAVIFQGHSIELCTEEWASEEEVRGMEPDGKSRIWNKARDEAERKIREEMGTVITLQMRGKGVKVRVCKKGDEIFNL